MQSLPSIPDKCKSSGKKSKKSNQEERKSHSSSNMSAEKSILSRSSYSMSRSSMDRQSVISGDDNNSDSSDEAAKERIKLVNQMAEENLAMKRIQPISMITQSTTSGAQLPHLTASEGNNV